MIKETLKNYRYIAVNNSKFVGHRTLEITLIWEDLQEIKAWYPHRIYLKQIGVDLSEWPEDIKYRFLCKDLNIFKRVRHEAIRRAEALARIEKRQ